MESIASVLKSQRERRKLSLSQVAADTRISTRHLQSIEEGRFEDLPGGMYNRAFLRAYCERLGLDQAEMLQRYESEASTRTEKPSRSRPPYDPGGSSLRIPPLVVWSLMLAVSATGIFLARKTIYEVFSPYFSKAPTPAVTYAPPPRVAPGPAAASPLPASVEPPSPQPGASAGTADPSVAPAGAGRSVAPPAAATAGAIVVEIEGKEKCWVSIDRDGSRALQKVMEPGEIQSVSALQEIEVVVGNAGGVRLRINGRRAKPLGKSGEVVRLLINQATLPELLDPDAG